MTPTEKKLIVAAVVEFMASRAEWAGTPGAFQLLVNEEQGGVFPDTAMPWLARVWIEAVVGELLAHNIVAKSFLNRPQNKLLIRRHATYDAALFDYTAPLQIPAWAKGA